MNEIDIDGRARWLRITSRVTRPSPSGVYAALGVVVAGRVDIILGFGGGWNAWERHSQP